ncbi:GGDEF domain-containing protein [Ruminococcus sp. OA3]|uniref:GGDEF domain-containing protein n=1 Tax=Ruminococcus sp. OA3 TaxID=2914164 RepID=UPI001F059C0D|nr:GGDEF domain-containing protein [Ruminococcus sp. OA3]MCH1983251.1 GGDEF domain-containing protein [Ruminococcus sp. OA3]
MRLLLLTAAAYFYFSQRYFHMTEKFSEMQSPRTLLCLLCYVVNYSFFYLCSVLEFPLTVNWFLFAFLLFIETLLYNKRKKRCALFATLTGIFFGLAANIFCRSVVAVVLDKPLQHFDNHVSSSANLKGIPVFLGFMLTGLIMHILSRQVFIERVHRILNHPWHQPFILEMIAGLFFYMFLNLLLYSTPVNDVFVKVWSIKSSMFSVIGLYIAVRYTIRICDMEDYREKNRKIQQMLEERSREEEELRRQAAIDPLTGLYNRQYADEKVESMLKQKVPFTICFFDLDHLKKVNDQLGHEEGDHYILTATEHIRSTCRCGKDLLCRYGGDEFLILFEGLMAEKAEKKAEAINDDLCAYGIAEAFPYSLSLSYGVVESPLFSDVTAMLQEADRKMYMQKRKKQLTRS